MTFKTMGWHEAILAESVVTGELGTVVLLLEVRKRRGRDNYLVDDKQMNK